MHVMNLIAFPNIALPARCNRQGSNGLVLLRLRAINYARGIVLDKLKPFTFVLSASHH